MSTVIPGQRLLGDALQSDQIAIERGRLGVSRLGRPGQVAVDVSHPGQGSVLDPGDPIPDWADVAVLQLDPVRGEHDQL